MLTTIGYTQDRYLILIPRYINCNEFIIISLLVYNKLITIYIPRYKYNIPILHIPYSC